MVSYQAHWDQWVDEEPKPGSSWSPTEAHITTDASEIKEEMFDIEQNTTTTTTKTN